MSAMSQKLQKLLAEPRFTGIYHLPHSDRKALKQAAQALRFGWLQADLDGLCEIAAALVKLGGDLRLPDWYGANYDALADCLTDLGWNDAPGYVLLVAGADALQARDEAAFATLNEVFATVVDHWRDSGIPFWVLYDLRADGLAELPTLAAG